MLNLCNLLLILLTIQFGMPVAAQLWFSLLLLYDQRMSLGIGIVPDARHQPADFHARLAPGNLEAMVPYFLSDVDRSIAAKTGQLVAKVAVEGLEPVGEFNARFSAGIEQHNAIIEVLHLRRLHEGVGEILAGWIERMIDLEGPRALGQGAPHVEIS